MFRVAANRRVVGTAVAVAAAAGIGLGAYSLGSGSGEQFPTATRAASASAGPDDAPASPVPAEGSPSSPLTLDEATAVAARAASAPGRVIEWDEDDEPTGLRYDVTLLHDDGTTTDVEVDTVTGQVTSVDHDTDRD
jgi:uncharacterized membrane protein YkoI